MGVYVHVPFCRTKCAYCAFLSDPDLGPAADWFRAVLTEARRVDPAGPCQTLYVGGGTPTALPVGLLEELLCTLWDILQCAEYVEVTVEANPDDVTPSMLAMLHRRGVTRLSIGVQSFRDDELRFLGRRHTADQARRAVIAARGAGFANLSIDLMYGFRGQRRDHWLHSLDEACTMTPNHLSCYQLTVEPGTPLGRRVAEGSLARVPESKEHAFFLATSQFLAERGYEHYEVSNFATPGCRSRHNSTYWARMPYLGLGPGAHSFDGRTRWWNTRSVTDYVRRLDHGESATAGSEMLTDEQVLIERLMLGFRTSEGVALETIRRCAGWEAVLDRLVGGGFVVQAGDRVVPTVAGMAIADRLPLEFSA